MSEESLDPVVAGALLDFAAFLTKRPAYYFPNQVDSLKKVLKEFMALRGVDQNCEPMVTDWPARCSGGRSREDNGGG